MLKALGRLGRGGHCPGAAAGEEFEHQQLGYRSLEDSRQAGERGVRENSDELQGTEVSAAQAPAQLARHPFASRDVLERLT